MFSFINRSLYSVVLEFNHRIERRQIRLTPMKNDGRPLKLRKKTNMIHQSGKMSSIAQTRGTSSSSVAQASNPAFTSSSSIADVHSTWRKMTTMKEKAAGETTFDSYGVGRGSFPSSSSAVLVSTLPSTSSFSEVPFAAPSSSHSSRPQFSFNTPNYSATANDPDALDAFLNPHDLVRYMDELAKSVKR